MYKVICLVFFLLLSRLHAQDTFFFGATTNIPGGTLVFENAPDYVASNLFCFGTSPGTASDSSAAGYYTDAQVFSALPAADPNAAAPGTVIQVKLLSVEGPAGAKVGFWEADAGSYGTNLTWSVPVPSAGNTNLIRVTEAPNSATNDPYGKILGRVFTFSKPGLYKVTWQLVDTSTNGPSGTPLEQPSAPFAIYYQADITIAGITIDTNGVNISFAAIDGSLIYNLDQSATLGSAANWEQTQLIYGDRRVHTVTIPNNGLVDFFRIRTAPNNPGT